MLVEYLTLSSSPSWKDSGFEDDFSADASFIRTIRPGMLVPSSGKSTPPPATKKKRLHFGLAIDDRRLGACATLRQHMPVMCCSHGNVLLLQTFYFANQEKTDACDLRAARRPELHMLV
jgi:hypothetical protein